MSAGSTPAEIAAADGFRRILDAERDGGQVDVDSFLGELAPEARGILRRMLADLALLRRRRDELGAAPSEGLVISNYRLERRLGCGGASTVWEAFEERLNRSVAVKLLHPHLALSERQLERFEREARLAASVRHPGLIVIHEVGRERSQPFLVEELIPDGVTLADWVAKRRDGAPDAPGHREFARLMQAVCAAVGALHQRGMAHRDLKPGNILIRPDGEPVVTDFGLAALVEGEPLSTTSLRGGTPFYIAPEQVLGQGSVDVRSDVFSLGVTLYECLTGQRPFEGDTPAVVGRRVTEELPQRPRQVAPGLPKDLEAICLVALEKDPRRRYQDASAMAADLDRHLAGEPILARPPGLWRRGWRATRRRPVLSSMVAAGAMVGLSLFAFGLRTAKLNEQIAQQNKDLTRMLAASRASAEYVAPGWTGARDPEPPAFLIDLADGARRIHAANPRAQSEQLAAVARMHASFGFNDEASSLLDEAAGLLEAVDLEEPAAAYFRIERVRLQRFRDEPAVYVTDSLRLMERDVVRDDPVLSALCLGYARIGLLTLQDFERANALVEEWGSIAARLEAAVEHVDRSASGAERSQLPDVEIVLANLYSREHEFDRAYELGERAFLRYLDRYGLNDYRTFSSGQMLLYWLGRYRGAGAFVPRWTEVGLAEYLLPVAERMFGPVSNQAVEARWALGQALLQSGDFEGAFEHYDFAAANYTRWVPDDSPRYLSLRVARAIVLNRLGRYDEARAELEVLVELRAASLGPANFNSIIARRALVEVLINQGEYRQAYDDLVGQWELFQGMGDKLAGDGLYDTLGYLRSVALAMGRPELALEWHRRTVEVLEELGATRAPLCRFEYLRSQGEQALATSDPEGALTAFESALEVLHAAPAGALGERTAGSLRSRVALASLMAGRTDAASELIADPVEALPLFDLLSLVAVALELGERQLAASLLESLRAQPESLGGLTPDGGSGSLVGFERFVAERLADTLGAAGDLSGWEAEVLARAEAGLAGG